MDAGISRDGLGDPLRFSKGRHNVDPEIGLIDMSSLSIVTCSRYRCTPGERFSKLNQGHVFRVLIAFKMAAKLQF